MLPNMKSVLMKTNSLDSSTTNSTSASSKLHDVPNSEEHRTDIVKYGYLRKYKTMKKKFFVLRASSESGPARLEYYDNEKRMKSNPKRSIVLQACFNINKKLDSKHKLAIALYTKDDCFSIVPETEGELEEWLTWLLALQQGHVTREGNITTIDKEAKPKPHFEFMWQISVKNKGLASKSPELLGPRRLCLTSTTLSLVKMTEERESLEFPLMGIRRCGHSDCFFFMEVGRSSITGAGEIWMQTEDTVIAQNMHEAILGAMKACRSLEDLCPVSRPRSASTSENGKSISSRQSTIASNTSSVMGSSNSIAGTCGGSTSSVAGSSCTDRSERNSLSSIGGALGGGSYIVQAIRDRCDSMPTRSRTVSEGHHDLGHRSYNFEILRSNSTYGHPNAYSPPIVSNPLSPNAGAFSDSAGSSHSMDETDNTINDFHLIRYIGYPSDGTLHTEPTIKEENPEEYLSMVPGELSDNMTDSGVVVDSRSSAYSTASTISVGSSTTSDYLQMEPNPKNVKLNSPPTSLSLSSNCTLTHQSNSDCSPQINSPTSSCPPAEIDSTLNRKESCGYVKMNSPQPTFNANAGYFMMSPGLCNDDNNQSVKPLEGGYVQMNPGTNSMPCPAPNPGAASIGSPNPDAHYHGYICMEASSLSSSLPKSIPQSGNYSDYVDHMSSPRSSHSLHDSSLSCSPADGELYPLEKVKSYFPPTEEDEDYIRPVRAYSIGSRPPVRKTHLVNHLEQSRVRAYSFGSQVYSSRFRGGRSGEDSSSGTSIPHVPGIDRELGVPKILEPKGSKKSSSAPILPNSGNLTPSNSIPAGPNASSRVSFNKLPMSRSTDSRKEDLMEINYDFSPSSHSRTAGYQDSRRLSIGSLRQRTNSRSSTSALAAALSSHNNQMTKSVKDGTKRNGALTQSSEQIPLPSSTTDKEATKSQENENKSETKKVEHGVAEKTNDYCEMSFSKTELQPSKVHCPDSDSQSGEYVNLDLSKLSWKLKDSKCCEDPINKITSNEAREEIHPVNSEKEQSHSYVNFTPEQKSVSLAQPESKSEYFEMNFIGSSKEKQSDKLSACLKESNASLLPKPSPVNGKKNEENDYCPVSTCEISPLSLSFNKKASDPSKANFRKMSSPPVSAYKAALDAPLILNSPNSLSRFSHPKLDRSLSKVIDKKNSCFGSEVALGGSKTSLADASYENIQIGSSLSSSPNTKGTMMSLVPEKELNYASLDLAPPVEGDDKVPRTTLKPGNGVSSSYQQPAKDVENSEETSPSALSYAEIDFTKSEGLRNVSGSLREGRV